MEMRKREEGTLQRPAPDFGSVVGCSNGIKDRRTTIAHRLTPEHTPLKPGLGVAAYGTLNLDPLV